MQTIEIEKITPHPNNPRIVYREDVVESIMAGIEGEMHEAYGLQVWPQGDGYVILSGHHRYEAARRKGLDSVPCFVRDDLDERGAYMVLVSSNLQGELSPLEIGMHALQYVDKSTGGRGKSGGLSEYAKQIGKDKSRISRYANAAEVVTNCCDDATVLMDRTENLSAIHKLPESCWQGAVSRMLDKGWTVKETEEAVKKVNAGIETVTAGLSETYPVDEVGQRLIAGKLTRKSISDLCNTHIQIQETAQEAGEQVQSFDKWDIRSMVKERERLEQVIYDKSQIEPVVYKQDAIEFIQGFDDGSIDLLLTDPPYSTDIEDIQCFVESWLSPALNKVNSAGRAYVFIGAYPQELRAYLNVAMPTQVLVWTYRNTLGPCPNREYKLNWQAILYYQMDGAGQLQCPIMNEQLSVQDINAPDGRVGDRYHEWQKPDEIAERFIKHASQEGDTVIDPFCGTGTFVLAAARLGRHTYGCDTEDDTLTIAEDRGCKRQ